MTRMNINEQELENVVGGTIIFNTEHTQCGYFCNNQYTVNDYNAAVTYILNSVGKMSERSMLNNMVAAGILTVIPPTEEE